MFVCPEGPFDLQIVYSPVLSLTLIFIVHSFRESSSSSFGSSQPYRGPPCRCEETGSHLQGDPPCGMKHSWRGSFVLWIGLDWDQGVAAAVRMGGGRLQRTNAGGQTSRRCTAFSSQTRKYHVEHRVESKPLYVYRHVLGLFLYQNIAFVKLQVVIITRNNAASHTKKSLSTYPKG